MNEEEFRASFDAYLKNLFSNTQMEAQASANHHWAPGRLPYASGNLANVAFKLEKTPTGYKLYIDQNVAFYASIIDQEGYYTSRYWDILAASIIRKISDDWGGSLSNNG